MSVVRSRVRVGANQAKAEHTSTSVIPKAILEFSDGIPALINAYYRWTDQEGEFNNQTKRLLDNIYSQTADEDAFKLIKNVILRNFPDSAKSDLKHLAKFAKEFYKQRGTLDSYKFLFRVLFDTNVDISYPGDFVLGSSDGEWVQNVNIGLAYVNDIAKIQGLNILGLESGASAYVTGLLTSPTSKGITTSVTLYDMQGTFAIDELVVCTLPDGDKIITRVLNSCGKIDIISKGKGYRDGVYIPVLSTGDGEGFSAMIKTVDDEGSILAIDIVTTGANYVHELPTLDMSHISLYEDPLLFEPAEVKILSTSAYNEPGYYRTQKSIPSSIFSRLHDGDYYQNYSYALRTDVPSEVFEEYVKKLVHPAGTKLFSSPTLDIARGEIDALIYRLSHPWDAAYNDEMEWSTHKFLDYVVKSYDELSASTNTSDVLYKFRIDTLLKYGDNYTTAADIIYKILIWNLINKNYDVNDYHIISSLSNDSASTYNLWTTQLDDIDLRNTYGLSTMAKLTNVRTYID